MECNKLHKLKIVGSFYCIVVFILFSLLSLRLFPVAGCYHRGDSHTLFALGPYFLFICYIGVFHISIFLPCFIRVSSNRDCSWWVKDEATPSCCCEGVCLHFHGTSTRDYCFQFVDWGLLYALWPRINTLLTQTNNSNIVYIHAVNVCFLHEKLFTCRK